MVCLQLVDLTLAWRPQQPDLGIAVDFARGLAVALLSLLRFLLLLIAVPALLIAAVLRWIFTTRPSKRQPSCERVPAHVKRRPDPCLYSQRYLMQQGLPVTWDNPDIWIVDLNGALVPSDALAPDQDYMVVARISNASFDAALGVSVRCDVRHWGVSGEDFVPVEVNADGSPAVRSIDIAPFHQVETTFQWRTPPQAGHYCIQVRCAHPDDINIDNNVGQENTNVVSVAPGSSTAAVLHLYNPYPDSQRFAFRADSYEIPQETWRMQLESEVIELGNGPILVNERTKPPKGTGATVRKWMFDRRVLTYRHYRYVGRRELFKSQLEARTEVPDGWIIKLNGRDLSEGVQLGPRESRDLELNIAVPREARGGLVPLNIVAWDTKGGSIGGVTVKVAVEA